MHGTLEEGRGEEADKIEAYVSKGLTKIDAETETGSSQQPFAYFPHRQDLT